jgi:peptidylprolyl isomerase domain and WD repeat-containing protein 1
MSEDSSVLGKRLRERATAQQVVGHDRSNSPPNDDESDEDVGPMPMPQNDAAGEVSKKKRKGNVHFTVDASDAHTQSAVLPHERLYLDHLPNADRYYKSFMHRDTINFCALTRRVQKKKHFPHPPIGSLSAASEQSS